MWNKLFGGRIREPLLIALAFMIGATFVAWAAQTNYLGTVFIADSTTPSQQLQVTSGGSVETTGYSKIMSFSITRPANTTVYTANTGWANATSGATYSTLSPLCDRASQELFIPQIDISSNNNPATKLQGILWIFDNSPTAINDNATFTLSSTDFAKVTGNMQGFPFTLTNVQGGSPSNSGVSLTGVTYHMACGNGSTAAFAMVQVVNAYTPASGEVLSIKLHVLGAN